MSFDFSTLITDRTQADVTAKNDKGTYNADDLNRVTAAMKYLDDTLRSYGYVTGYQRLEVPHTDDSQLPSGYTKLEYIQSSGTQYVDSGFKPNNNSRVVLDFEPTDAYSSIVGIFGTRDENSGTAANMFVFWNNGANTFRTDYFGTQQTMTVSTLLARQTVDKDKNVTTIGSVSVSNAASTGQCSNNLYLFCTNAAGTANYFAKLKLYSCQIYDNGTLARDFVPCISDSGDVGLYDIVEEQFYANSGTGVFTAGDAVDEPITGDESDTEYDAYTWYEYDLPTKDLMEIYLANVLGLYEVILSEPELPTTMEKLTYQGANQIEQALVTLNTAIKQIVAGFARSNSFAFWSGNRPFPTAQSDRGRNWAQLDAMETSWRNWQAADWYLLLYGNLKAEGDVV